MVSPAPHKTLPMGVAAARELLANGLQPLVTDGQDCALPSHGPFQETSQRNEKRQGEDCLRDRCHKSPLRSTITNDSEGWVESCRDQKGTAMIEEQLAGIIRRYLAFGACDRVGTTEPARSR